MITSLPTEFVITGSIDGHLKFWKKQYQGIDFVKQYRAHTGISLLVTSGKICGVSLSNNGLTLCTASPADSAVKVFDIVNFDMINMIKLKFVPCCIEFVNKQSEPTNIIAISEYLDSCYSVVRIQERYTFCMQMGMGLQ